MVVWHAQLVVTLLNLEENNFFDAIGNDEIHSLSFTAVQSYHLGVRAKCAAPHVSRRPGEASNRG